MNLKAYRDEIKFKLTGYVLQNELSTQALNACVNNSFREIQRYITTPILMTIPYKSCIDLTDYKVSSVTMIYRPVGNGFTTSGGVENGNYVVDPMQMNLWQFYYAGNNISNFNTQTLNLGAYSLMQGIRNTLSTDLDFFFDKNSNKLYINCSQGVPQYITVEYIPRYDNVQDVISDYWIDIIMRLAVANAKIAVGRIRTRFTQSNALWSQDGEALLQQGNAELQQLRTHLVQNNDLFYPKD